MSTGGSIESISYAGREFNVPGDADPNFKMGGMEGDVQPNGNDTVRLILTRSAHSVPGLTIDIDHSRGDLVFLQERANGKIFEDFTMTLVDGAVYQGESHITGELTSSPLSAVATVNFMGPKLTLQ